MKRLLVVGFLVGTTAVTTACGAKPEKTFTPEQVARVLAAKGFDVKLVLDRRRGARSSGSVLGLLELYGKLKGLQVVYANVGPGHAVGGVISAWIFDSQRDARALKGGDVRIWRGNVVVLVRATREMDAVRALARIRPG